MNGVLIVLLSLEIQPARFSRHKSGNMHVKFDMQFLNMVLLKQGLHINVVREWGFRVSSVCEHS